jgi:hypothetical protein
VKSRSMTSANQGDQNTAAESHLARSEALRDPVWTRRWLGWLALAAGWLIPQIALLGPALIGWTVDLPVDLLAASNVNYLPDRPEFANVRPYHADDLFDLVIDRPLYDFAAQELRSGRLPSWQPANFAGAPYVAGYSPFGIPYYLAPHPITLAWIALLQDITIGLGMWFLLRCAFRLSYWPSAIGSWCAPLTGFMTVWHGFATIGPFCWLPWSLWAADRAIKNPRGFGSIGVAIVTALILLSGHPGIGGLVLLTTGLYCLWLLGDAIRIGQRWRTTISSAVAIGFAWFLGFLLAAPYLIPLFDYARTGIRIELRSRNYEERPPQGIAALAAIVVPDIYGGDVRADWHRVSRVILPESSSGAYVGLLAALWLAPLAWRDRVRRSQVIFLTLLAAVSLGWTLNVPGFVDLLRSEPLRPLSSLSYNRWVLATGLSVLILAAIGLEHLRGTAPEFRFWFLVPILATAGFGAWCFYNRLTLVDPLGERLFALCFDVGAGLSLAALIGWAATVRPIPAAKWIRIAIVALLPLELFRFAWNERRQADMALYLPPIPVLEKVATLPRGRIWGIGCLPANLNRLSGLEDVRGYDGVDPGKFIKLIKLAIDPQQLLIPYAITQCALPLTRRASGRFSLHPVADLLNVRYLIYRQRPPAELPVILEGDGYWIAENRAALPRSYVPRAVRVVPGDHVALAEMASFDFNPRETAYTTDELRLPNAIRGQASVRYETPTKAEIDVDMQTAGLVVLADLWDPGWRAELDGVACPISRVNVALRGFQVPAGKHRIICVYDPRSVRIGFRGAGAGGLLLLLWAIWKWRRSVENPENSAPDSRLSHQSA